MWVLDTDRIWGGWEEELLKARSGGRQASHENKGLLFKRERDCAHNAVCRAVNSPKSLPPGLRCALSLDEVTPSVPTKVHEVYPSPSYLIFQPNWSLT